MKRPIYLDHHATTPLDRRVLDAMMPYLTEEYGNAASVEHRYGWVAEEAVAAARRSLATSLGARSEKEILFTSGATESNNLAILGALEAYARKGKHVVTLTTEHKAVLDPCLAWMKRGGEATFLDVEPDGLVDLQRLEDALREDTVLVSIMAANNEIGVLQDIRAIGEITRRKGVLFHSDATQAVGKVPLNVVTDQVDLLSFSGHKIYGPKGVGGLYLSRRSPRVVLKPLLHGGGHEAGLRSGTLNVPGIVGLAHALELSLTLMEEESSRLKDLRDRLFDGLNERYNLILNGHPQRRLPGNLNVAFPELKVENLVREIYGEIALSSGAACTSANPEPSHVLRAIERYEGERAASSIRFGLGRGTTEQDIDTTLDKLRAANALTAYQR